MLNEFKVALMRARKPPLKQQAEMEKLVVDYLSSPDTDVVRDQWKINFIKFLQSVHTIVVNIGRDPNNFDL